MTQRSLVALLLGLLLGSASATGTARAHGDPAETLAPPSPPPPRLPPPVPAAEAPGEPQAAHEPGDANALGELPTPAADADPSAAPEAHREPPEDEAEADESAESPEGSGLSAASRAQSVNPTAEGLNWEVPVSFAQSFNLRGFRRDSQLTYDPTYTWTLSVSPRWNVRERVSIGARQDATLELTESDVTTRQRQYPE